MNLCGDTNFQIIAVNINNNLLHSASYLCLEMKIGLGHQLEEMKLSSWAI